MPLSVVTPPDEPAAEPRPDVPWSETVILEAHVRGWTKLHPEVPAEQRGTYLGMAHPAVIEHLKQDRRDRGRAAARHLDRRRAAARCNAA